MFGCGPVPTFPCFTGSCGTSSKMAGRTRNSSSSVSMVMKTHARKWKNGRRRKWNAFPAFPTQKPSTLIWCMGQTQHTVGTANVRASCMLLLLTGNVGAPGTGANIFRGHDNVQGATDVGLDVVTLPFYYGLTEAAWKHWSRVWEVDYNYLLGRFDDKKIMETPGIPLTRWFDAVLLPKDQVAQKDNLKAMFVQGHASNSITRIPESLKGLKEVELLVITDPHPTTWASLAVQSGRKDNMYLLPVATQFECRGSRVASNRALQWGEQIVKPIFESKTTWKSCI